jgi:hypothetical protein
LQVQPALAPEHVSGVLVMREDDYVMARHPAHDPGASTSHTAPPTSNAAVARPEQELRHAGSSPAHFDEAKAEQALWQEFRDYGASIDNVLTEALQVHGGASFHIFQVCVSCRIRGSFSRSLSSRAFSNSACLRALDHR